MADKSYKLKFHLSDGSEKSVEFTAPQGEPGVVDVPSAKVGQIIQVKAVDASGKPTAWEAVDMPSGGGAELDATLTDSTKAAPANILGEVKYTAEAAAHAAVIAGEGALVMPYMETYAKLMAGKSVADQFIHVSDKVPTMADLEAGFSAVMQEPIEADGILQGAYALTVEFYPKAFSEELFAEFVVDMGGIIICGGELGVFIVSTDNTTVEGITFPKKGVYIYPGICAFRINGYSFSEGDGGGMTYEYRDTVTWGSLIGRNVSEFENVLGEENSDGTMFYTIKVADGTEPTLKLLQAGVEVVAAYNGETSTDTVTDWACSIGGLYTCESVGYLGAAYAAEAGLSAGWYLIVVCDSNGVINIRAESNFLTSMTIPGYRGFKVEVEGGNSDTSGVVYFEMTDTGEKDDNEHPIYSTSLSASEINELYRSGANVMGRIADTLDGQNFDVLYQISCVSETAVLVCNPVFSSMYVIIGNTATHD